MIRTKTPRVQLVERRKPRREQSRESVDAILATAAVLLDEVGIEGFNTNLLAERAGVRVRTVYRYFPNKYSVIFALTESLSVQWDSWMSSFYRGIADPRMDWRQALRLQRLEWISKARKVPGAISVLQAINATPELGELHGKIFDDMAEKVAAALSARGLRLPRSRLLAIAQTLVTLLNGATDVYVRLGPQRGARFMKEVRECEVAYLATYLDGAKTN